MLETAKWNYKRGNTKFDYDLETSMLEEEAQEFKEGLEMYFEALGTDNDTLPALVEMVDAYCDYKFVFNGTMFKALGTSTQLVGPTIHLDYMYGILGELGLLSILGKAYSAVTVANNDKGSKKVNGKIQKGDSWIDPKLIIENLIKGVI